MAEKWISVSEAAQAYGYHAEHLRELIREGKVKARKFATVWQIDRQNLEGYIRQARKRGEKTGRKR